MFFLILVEYLEYLIIDHIYFQTVKTSFYLETYRLIIEINMWLIKLSIYSY